MADGSITLTLSRVEASALLKVAGTGLRVTNALELIQNTGAAETALNRLREATVARAAPTNLIVSGKRSRRR